MLSLFRTQKDRGYFTGEERIRVINLSKKVLMHEMITVDGFKF